MARCKYVSSEASDMIAVRQKVNHTCRSCCANLSSLPTPVIPQQETTAADDSAGRAATLGDRSCSEADSYKCAGVRMGRTAAAKAAADEDVVELASA
jgi:hypothetical protein